MCPTVPFIIKAWMCALKWQKEQPTTRLQLQSKRKLAKLWWQLVFSLFQTITVWWTKSLWERQLSLLWSSPLSDVQCMSVYSAWQICSFAYLLQWKFSLTTASCNYWNNCIQVNCYRNIKHTNSTFIRVYTYYVVPKQQTFWFVVGVQ